MDGSRIGYRPGYYPQVIGLREGETDSLAGSIARLYIHGISNWELLFYGPGEVPDPDDIPAPEPEPAPPGTPEP
jgi:hypothetical protein